jgi:hypothetical protein
MAGKGQPLTYKEGQGGGVRRLLVKILNFPRYKKLHISEKFIHKMQLLVFFSNNKISWF